MSEPSVAEVARENQRTLIETQQKLALALNATELGLWSWDSETNQIVWDERMRGLHGYDAPLAPRVYSEKLVHPEDRHVIEALLRALPSGTFPQTSYRIVRPDGSVRWLLLVGQATLDETGRLRRVMGGSLDVTRQRELEEQLRKSQKMTAITSLTAGIAHNFNNMLAVILPILEFATGIVPRQHQRLLRDATHAAQRAAELVEQLMTYAGHSTTSQRRKVCDVDELVRAAVGICRRAFDAHIQVKIKQSATPLSIVCNPGQVEQVIVNLLLNARDAINEANMEKGVINVRVRASSDTGSVSKGFVCIDVADNGGGLSDQARAHLFEPFFTTKSIGKGTGLGLATSYAIARDHGGLLSCPSSSRRGTQFTLRLPLDPNSAVEPVLAPEPKLESGTVLLLVDDDDAVRTTLRSVLSAQGNIVFQADSGAEALEQLRAHPDVQVILLDRSMPGGHGETFIPALRALAPNAPIVFVSGYSIDAELAGLADAVVMKPVGGSTLSRVIQQVLAGEEGLMQLLALSDLHIEHRPNREALTALRSRKQDWLILAGDVSDSVAGLAWTLDVLGPKFARLLWVPGNHELWTGSADGERERGEARYQRLVQVCRERSVLTPEDAFVEWPLLVQGQAVRIALLFLLYDYSFAPDAHVGRDAAVAWAADAGVLAADEVRLHPDPYPSREAWCQARVSTAEVRLAQAAQSHALVLVNHWPLRRELVRLGRVARYAPWCGTRASESFHRRYRALVSVHGHLHVRATDERDGVRFEEVSLGYPGHWDHTRALDSYLRQIL